MLQKYLDEEYKNWGLTINPSKMEYPVLGNLGNNLSLRDTKIKHRDYYKYFDVKGNKRWPQYGGNH